MLAIEVKHRRGWGPWRVQGRPVHCTDRGAAYDALLGVIEAGEQVARAVAGQCTEMQACIDPDGMVTISGRNGYKRVALGGNGAGSPISPRHIGQDS